MKEQILPAEGKLCILIPRAEHDIFKQLIKLQNTLRHIMGEDLITHLGLDYYQEFVDTL